MKENINILIESKDNLTDEIFKKEVLSYGNVKYYENGNIYEVECINKNLNKPGNYKCFGIKGKKLLMNFMIILFFSFLENCK